MIKENIKDIGNFVITEKLKSIEKLAFTESPIPLGFCIAVSVMLFNASITASSSLSSIKFNLSIASTISNELNYENLEVKDGGMAQDAYRQTIDSKITEESKQYLRLSMLEYCKQDTLAMVKIVHSWSAR